MASNKKKWYVVHTYSGYENKVKINLEQRVKSMGMENQIFQVLIPTEKVLEVKSLKNLLQKWLLSHATFISRFRRIRKSRVIFL